MPRNGARARHSPWRIAAQRSASDQAASQATQW